MEIEFCTIKSLMYMGPESFGSKLKLRSGKLYAKNKSVFLIRYGNTIVNGVSRHCDMQIKICTN